MEHTPTPWRWQREWKEDGRYSGRMGELQPGILWYGMDGEEGIYCPNEANAAFIVKACNNYEALVEALKTIAVVNLSNSPLKMEIIEQNCTTALEAAGEL